MRQVLPSKRSALAGVAGPGERAHKSTANPSAAWKGLQRTEGEKGETMANKPKERVKSGEKAC